MDHQCQYPADGFQCYNCCMLKDRPEFRFTAIELFQKSKVSMSQCIPFLLQLRQKAGDLSFDPADLAPEIIDPLCDSVSSRQQALSNIEVKYFDPNFREDYTFEMPHVSSY